MGDSVRNLKCVLCYKPGSSSGSRFISIFSRYLKLASNHGEQLVPEAELRVCEDCAVFGDSFCDLYVQLEWVRLELDWKVRRLFEMMTCAGRVSSRCGAFRKQFEVDESGEQEAEQLRDNIQAFRKHLIKSCKLKLRRGQPQLKIRRVDEATPRKLKTEINSPSKSSPTTLTVHLLTLHALLSLSSINSELFSTNSCSREIFTEFEETEDVAGHESNEKSSVNEDTNDSCPSPVHFEDEPEAASAIEVRMEDEDNWNIVEASREEKVAGEENETSSLKQSAANVDMSQIRNDHEQKPEENEDTRRRSHRALLKCPKCPKTFSHPKTLEHHVKDHEENDDEDSSDEDEAVKNEMELEDDNEIESSEPSSSSESEEDEITKGISKQDAKNLSKHKKQQITRLNPSIPSTQCEVCQSTFPCEPALEKHRALTHKLERYVRCPICSVLFPGFPAYLKHRTRIDSRRKPSKCRKKSNKNSMLSAHRHQFPSLTCEKFKPYLFCPNEDCYEVFAHEQYLQLHLKTHGSWSCRFCPQNFPKAHELSWHEVLSHKPENASKQDYNCTRCQSTFGGKNGKSNFTKHFLIKHLSIPDITREPVATPNEKQFSICSLTFLPTLKEAGIKKHMKKWHDFEGMDPSEISKCKMCPAQFRLPVMFTMHMKTIHLIKEPHDCPKCAVKFECPSKLRLHLKTVHKEDGSCVARGFKCPICGKRFAQLKIHMAAHERDKKGTSTASYFKPGIFKCEICNNGRIYGSKMRLYMHQRLMHKKPNKTACCEKCGKVFKSGLTLKQHVDYVHTDPKEWKFVCSEEGCGRRCFSEQKLKEHLRTHTKECPFICDFCGEKYRYRQYLRAHLKKVHGEKAAATLPGRAYFKPFNETQKESEAE